MIEYLNKRVLWSKSYGVNEGFVEEISDSENCIKIDGEWYNARDVLILEVLPDITTRNSQNNA